MQLAPVPNIKMESYAVYTDHSPCCMMRGIGNSQFNFALGRVVDGLAEQLGTDPLELAKRTSATEWGSCPDDSLIAVLEAGAEGIGWKEQEA